MLASTGVGGDLRRIRVTQVLRSCTFSEAREGGGGPLSYSVQTEQMPESAYLLHFDCALMVRIVLQDWEGELGTRKSGVF